MKHKQLVLIAAVAFAMTARADWDIGDAAKWIQLPDLGPTGLDVLASLVFQPSGSPNPNTVLADDFLCTTRGKITDIHVWGSWLNDIDVDPAALRFHLSIHADIPDPDGPGPEHSKPGDLLWYATMAPTRARVYGTASEQFFDPDEGIIGSDNVVWQYNFIIPATWAFEQQGTLNDPIVYWLDVQAVVPYADPMQPLWGWKTSLEHWNDDAVYGHAGWSELRYPLGHSFEGQSIDLAFVITPEPGTMYGAVLLLGYLGVHWYRRSLRSRA